MSFIGKLPNFNSLTTVPQEPQPETTSQPPVVQTNTGIAKTNDGFETANPMIPNLFGLVGEQTEILVSNQTMIPPDPTVDASTLFDYVIDVQEPAPPVPPDYTDPMNRKEFRPDPMEEPNKKALPKNPEEEKKLAEIKMQDYEKRKAKFEEQQRMSKWDLGLSGEITDTIFDGMREIGLGDAADWLQDTGNDAVGIAGSAINWAGGAVVDAAKATGQAVGDAGEWTVDAAEDIAEAAAKAAEDAAKAAAKAAADAAAAVADAAEDVIDEVGEVLEDVGEAVGDVADDVGEFLGDLW